MNFNEFTKIMILVSEYYGRTLTESATMVYFEAAKELDSKTFQALVLLHMNDPEQGKFFPTFAHLVGQAGTEADAARAAGIEFDQNPRIDGIGSFDFKQETPFLRDARRKRYVAMRVNSWINSDALTRIARSSRVPVEFKREAISHA